MSRTSGSLSRSGTGPVFLVTSVIHCTDSPLSYCPHRSVFDAETRAAQTVKTVESIRERFSGAHICLIEMGTSAELPSSLCDCVDSYLFLGSERLIRWACDGPYKGLGEALGLLRAASRLQCRSNWYYKISGRYRLNDNFARMEHDGAQVVGKMYGNSLSTRLYAWPAAALRRWQRSLLFSIPALLKNVPLEVALARGIGNRNLHLVPILGVEGEVAVTGEFLSE